MRGRLAAPLALLVAMALVFGAPPVSAAAATYRLEIVCVENVWLALAYRDDRLSDLRVTGIPCRTAVAGVEQGPASGSVDPIVEGPVEQQAATR